MKIQAIDPAPCFRYNSSKNCLGMEILMRSQKTSTPPSPEPGPGSIPAALIQALQESSRQVLAHVDFKETAQAIYIILKKYLGAVAGYVALLSKDGRSNELLFLDAGGLTCRVDPNLPMPVRGIRAEAYRTGRVVYDNNFPESPWADFLPRDHARLDNVLFAPLKIREKVVGVIGLANKPGGFTDQDAQAAGIFGELAAVAFDQLQTAERLRISEEHFRAVALTATDGIVSTDRDGRIIFWNPKAEALFGYSEQEVLGRPLDLLIPHRLQKSHQQAMKRVRHSGLLRLAGKTMETVGQHRKGREIPLELSLSCWESNGESRFTAIIRDISERKQAERERRRIEEAQLFLLQCGYLHPGENFFESVARYLSQNLEMDYVCIDRLEGDGLTARTVAIYFDGKFEDNVAYRLEDTPCGEVVGKTICCFPREVRRLFPRDAVLQEMLAESYVGTTLWNLKGQPIGLIAMIGRKPLADAHPAESLLKLVALRAAGELERTQAQEALRQAQNGLEERVRERTTELTRANEQLKSEITSRIHIQNALEESERKFRAIFNQTFQVIGLLKPEGTVLEINQTALDYFQIKHQDSLGKPLWDLRGGKGAKAIRTRLKEAIAQAAEGKLVRLELPLRLDQKTIRTMDFSIKPVFNPGGLLPLLIIEGRDITERKQSEITLKASAEQLRLLSSQVLQAQEKERKRIARELHDGIGQYLSAIKYRVEHLLLTRLEWENASHNLATLDNVIPVIQGAIEEVRRICMALRPSTLDDLGVLATISWFCREFQATYPQILIKQKIRAAERQIPDLLKTVVFRIIQEALNNISKHSQANQIRLSLVKKDHHLHLDIRDNGLGFEGRHSYPAAGTNRGLGLAGMKERAELSGGTLSIKSQPGKGTRIQADWTLNE
jgi:PAS domain S-box-containing protein